MENKPNIFFFECHLFILLCGVKKTEKITSTILFFSNDCQLNFPKYLISYMQMRKIIIL